MKNNLKVYFEVYIKIFFRRLLGVEIKRYKNLRPAIEFADNYLLNKSINCAEIGVRGGTNAYSILKYVNLTKLYLIDPYKEYQSFNGKWYNNKYLTKAEKRARRRLKKFEDKIVWIKETSDIAIEKDLIPEGIDFIYIDGNHTHPYISKDLRNYYTKLKTGGILAGHDSNLPEVNRAIKEFANKNKLQLYIQLKDWWIIKKETSEKSASASSKEEKE